MTAEWLTMLIDAGVKATAILLLAGLIAISLRRASAATRHFVWTLALGSLLALPVLTRLVPAWQIPVASDSVVRFILARDVRPQPLPARTIMPNDIAPTADPVTEKAPDRRTRAATVRAAADRQDASPSLPDATSTSGVESMLLLIWGIGAALVLLRLAAGSIAVWWIARRTSPLEDRSWRDLRDIVVAQIGIATTPALLQGEKAATPMTWGLLRPVVLLPPDAQGWSEDRRRIVLLHEVAHVKRRDCLTQTLAHVACAVYWFNPLVWIASARMQAERERACDDLVLSSGTVAADYARHLLEIARSLRVSGGPAWATVSMARPSQLEGRLLAILDPALSRRTITGVRRAAGMLVIVGLVVPLAALHVSEVSAAAASAKWPAMDFAQSKPAPETPAPVTVPAPAQPAEPRPEPRPQANPAPRVARQSLDEDAIDKAIEMAMQSGGAAMAGMDREEIADSVREALQNLDPDTYARQIDYGHAALEAMGMLRGRGQTAADRKTNDQAVQALAGALKDQDVGVRRQAAQALGELRNSLAVPGLIDAVKDGDAGVRQAAIGALGELRDTRSVDALSGALKDTDPGVRRRAISALGELRDPRALPGLIDATRAEDVEIRQRAISALSEFRDARVVDPLIAATKDGDAGVRQRAVSALGEIRDPRAVEPLMAAAKDTDIGVRQRAIAGLGEQRDARAVPVLIAALKGESPATRQRAASALGELRDARAVEALTAALKDPDAGLRARAADALGEIRDGGALDALTAALSDQDPNVRRHVVEALRQLGVGGKAGGRR